MQPTWNPETLPDAVLKSKSWTDLHLFLGLKRAGGSQLRRWVKKLGLSTEHFTGEWQTKHILPDKVVFCENSKHVWRAKARYYKRTPDQYMLCSQGSTWNGQPLRFQIDHKNGEKHDCRWENLRKVCPNCHTQTDTFCGRNRVVTDGVHNKINGQTIWCNGCCQWLVPSMFGNKASMPNGKQSRCVPCMESKTEGAANGA